MKPLLLLMALASSASAAEPMEGRSVAPLQLHPKAALVTAMPHDSAPFVFPTNDEHNLGFVKQQDPRHSQSRSSCDSDRVLCYDPESARVVYKPARALMPDLPGLTRENISVRRDRIVLRYSFQ